MMTSRQKFYLSLGLLVVWFLATTVLRNNFHTQIRYFSDEFDRSVYFARGSWFASGQIPYKDVLSEYPQIPTYIFGLFYLPVLKEQDGVVAYLKYSSLFSLAMLALLGLLVNHLYKELPEAKYRAFMLLLPAPLYFTVNRFDILPAYLCVLSFFLIKTRKWDAAAIVLGFAAMTKWYPVLLVVPSSVYYFYSERKLPWRFILLFFATCLIIVLPTLSSGGVDAILVPYRFQGVRGLSLASLPALLSKLVAATFQTPVSEKYYLIGFLFLQVITAFASLLFRIDSIEKLLQWWILITTTFILFSRIHSPQWALWILPFLILASTGVLDPAIITLYSITTYIEFPIVYDLYGEASGQTMIMVVIYSVILTLVCTRAILRIRHLNKNAVASPIRLP